MNNCKNRENKQLWSILWYYTAMFLEGRSKELKTTVSIAVFRPRFDAGVCKISCGSDKHSNMTLSTYCEKSFFFLF
jgi:hypothetical protein